MRTGEIGPLYPRAIKPPKNLLGLSRLAGGKGMVPGLGSYPRMEEGSLTRRAALFEAAVLVASLSCAAE